MTVIGNQLFFMDYKAFRLLLKRYLDGSCSEEEKRLVDQWYELVDNEHDNLPDAEADDVEERLWNKIRTTTVANTIFTAGKKKSPWRKYAAAACIVGVAGAAILWWTLRDRSGTAAHASLTAKVEAGFLKLTNLSDTVKAIALEDGSVVSVHPGATLAYPEHFAAAKREVYLDGQAFFNVSKNADRPFYVYNNSIVTQVLGTSFGVREENGQIEVAVKTGKVVVYENKDELQLSPSQQKSNGVIITPNQRVTYYEEARHFVTSIVEQPVLVPNKVNNVPDKPAFNYNETALSVILNDLEKAYELEIELENGQLKNCPFTGDLSGQNLFNQLEGICLVFNASYEIKGTRILLKGGKQCD